MTAQNQAHYDSDPHLYAAAYAAVKARFGLKATQRDQLDASPLYSEILQAAHLGRWDAAGAALSRAGILGERTDV